MYSLNDLFPSQVVLHWRLDIRAIAERGCGSQLTPTEYMEGICIFLIQDKLDWLDRWVGILVTLITEWLILAEATPAPEIALSFCESSSEGLPIVYASWS